MQLVDIAVSSQKIHEIIVDFMDNQQDLGLGWEQSHPGFGGLIQGIGPFTPLMNDHFEPKDHLIEKEMLANPYLPWATDAPDLKKTYKF